MIDRNNLFVNYKYHKCFLFQNLMNSVRFSGNNDHVEQLPIHVRDVLRFVNTSILCSVRAISPAQWRPLMIKDLIFDKICEFLDKIVAKLWSFRPSGGVTSRYNSS